MSKTEAPTRDLVDLYKVAIGNHANHDDPPGRITMTELTKNSPIPPLSRGLPKWPKMLTTGSSVTVDQAKEIIRRTDTFLTEGQGGNDHAWEARLATRLRMPHYHDYSWPNTRPLQDYYRRANDWRGTWGMIETEYVGNSWISTCFVGGPHGWCWPDGRIAYADNVGKWPSVEDVLRDWSAIARAFPFLDLAATLMSGESCEDDTTPIVTILVKDGAASAEDGSLRHHEAYGVPAFRPDRDLDFDRLFDPDYGREHGPIPEAWYAEWEERARGMRLDGGPA